MAVEERHHGSEATTISWRDYPITTFREAPREIDVIFTGQGNALSTGSRRTRFGSGRRRLAEAVYDACAVRVRRLPLTPVNLDDAR